jgi:transglutaminase-like putative cysteine protease
MIIQFPKQKVNDDLYDSVMTKYFQSIVYYTINSKYRTSVKLTEWLKEQIDNPMQIILDATNEIEDTDDYDVLMIRILRYIRNRLTYIGDITNWKMNEYWARAFETLESDLGDCEDGAILMYVLARLKGVPANRLMIFAGDVKDPSTQELVGHCWLGYKPNGYPIDYVNLDWCYYYTNKDIMNRNKFHYEGTEIQEHSYTDELIPLKSSNYKEIWFGFNENRSHKSLTYNLEL